MPIRHDKLMPNPFRSVGRRLRAYVLPLVGFWHLLAKLEDLRERVGKLESTNNTVLEAIQRVQDRINEIGGYLGGRIDALTDVLSAQERTLIATVAEEVDRLDAYLCFHVAMLHDSAAAIRTDHAASLQESTAAVRGDLDHLRAIAERPQRSITAPGVDALVVAAGFDLIVPTIEAGLLAYILRHGLAAIEPGVRAVLRDHLKPGAVAVDAGANIGIHAINMASFVGSSGSVLCFEPLPHLARALERTLHLNGFSDRAQVRQMALSDTIGEATFYRAAHAPLSSLFPIPEEIGAEPLPVQVTTLDECFAPRSRVDLVKMDVEGAEPRMWRGMQRVLADNIEIKVVLEWSASHFLRTGENPNAFMAEIRAAGFSPYMIADNEVDGGLTPLQKGIEGVEAKNLFLTRFPVVHMAAVAKRGAMA